MTDTIVHLANIGLYGTEKMIILKNNFFGDNNKYKVYDGIYDQEKNYSLPKIILEPFLNLPLNSIDAHIYKIFNGINGLEINEAAQPINSISSFIFRSNKELDYSNAIIKYVNLKNDTTLIETENRIKYNITILDNNNVKIDLLEPVNYSKFGGYFNIQNLLDTGAFYFIAGFVLYYCGTLFLFLIVIFFEV